jgi:hypothetical protein
MESIFGEMPFALKFFLAFLFVLALMAVVFWVVRMLGVGGPQLDSMRGRQPRLAVIDAAQVDSRRRLILIRRDNIEHLLMIGGPTDIVVEPNIVRAVPAGREASVPPRPPAAADTLPRPAPLGETAAWPLQPEAAPRPQRAAPEESEPWPQEVEPAPQPPAPPPRRTARSADPLAGLAAEAGRFPEPRGPLADGPPGGPPSREGRQREAVRERDVEREPVREREGAREREPARAREASLREPSLRESSHREQSPRDPAMREQAEPVRERPAAREREGARMREVQAAPPEDFNADADQNLADMAQRLEAALRRPGKGAETRGAEVRGAEVRTMSVEPEAAPPPSPRPAPPEPKPAKSLYDSLEKEMASLLGRPSGKS